MNNFKLHVGNSLVVQWLGLCTFTAKGLGSIPGWGTKIPQHGQKTNYMCFGEKKEEKSI